MDQATTKQTALHLDAAQDDWAALHHKAKAQVFRRLRDLLARDSACVSLLGELRGVSEAEALATEILPLAEGLRWLEKCAAQALRPKKISARGRPLWLADSALWEVPRPCGRVLVAGPSNYPLFLLFSPAFQALAAGNSVILKPPPGAEAACAHLVSLMQASGVPDGLVHLASAEVAEVETWLQAGVQRVVFTGSSDNGQKLLKRCAEHLVPAIVELSGSDSVWLLPEADLSLAAKSVAFAMTLNQGRTCMAPRRVYVPFALKAPFQRALLEAVKEIQPEHATHTPEAERSLEHCIEAGASCLLGDAHTGPTLLDNISTDMPIWTTSIFAPIAGLYAYESLEAMIELDDKCPYRLTASIFGPKKAAQHLASRLRVPTVTINDVIVPTADPRVAFGGWSRSGWGLCRGEAGLMQLCDVQRQVIRRGPLRPHLNPKRAGDLRALKQMLHWLHAHNPMHKRP
jgi:acyl-CoA reductase-like NAD-dependent aldehyde dehydrogenase